MRPWHLLPGQAAAIATQVGAGLRSLRPARDHPRNPEALIDQVRPPPEHLIESFLDWSNGSPARYAGVVPPHLFTRWGFPMMVRLMAQTRYPLTRVLNQGCSLRLNRPLPRGEPLIVSGRIVNIDEDTHRARIHMRLVTGTRSAPDALENDLHSVIVLGPRTGRHPPRDTRTRKMEDIGSWSAARGDGLEFALLTGDFNPIHWFAPAGRMTPFGGCILQGFGSFVRSYEALANDCGAPVEDIDVRFTKPVRLPTSDLAVLRSVRPGRDGRQRLELRGGEGVTHLAGSFVQPGQQPSGDRAGIGF